MTLKQANYYCLKAGAILDTLNNNSYHQHITIHSLNLTSSLKYIKVNGHFDVHFGTFSNFATEK